MRLAAALVLLMVMTPFAHEHVTDLESEIFWWGDTELEKRNQLSAEFMFMGDFGFPYHRLKITEESIGTLTTCTDEGVEDEWRHGDEDTQVGVIMLSCAYKLGWFTAIPH